MLYNLALSRHTNICLSTFTALLNCSLQNLLESKALLIVIESVEHIKVNFYSVTDIALGRIQHKRHQVLQEGLEAHVALLVLTEANRRYVQSICELVREIRHLRVNQNNVLFEPVSLTAKNFDVLNIELHVIRWHLLLNTQLKIKLKVEGALNRIDKHF